MSETKAIEPLNIDFLDVVERGKKGDKTALPAIRKILDTLPSARKVFGAELEDSVVAAIATGLGGKLKSGEY